MSCLFGEENTCKTRLKQGNTKSPHSNTSTTSSRLLAIGDCHTWPRFSYSSLMLTSTCASHVVAWNTETIFLSQVDLWPANANPETDKTTCPFAKFSGWFKLYLLRGIAWDNFAPQIQTLLQFPTKSQLRSTKSWGRCRLPWSKPNRIDLLSQKKPQQVYIKVAMWTQLGSLVELMKTWAMIFCVQWNDPNTHRSVLFFQGETQRTSKFFSEVAALAGEEQLVHVASLAMFLQIASVPKGIIHPPKGK